MIKKILDILLDLFLILFRHIGVPAKLELLTFGNPGSDAPVLMSGNYLYTVKQLKKILKNCDCYLLIGKSGGSNVWCAAGMGDFTELDIIDSINFTGIGNRVNHRILILPPAASVGIDTKVVFEKTGWQIQWGPYHFKYLKAYLRLLQNTTKVIKNSDIPDPLMKTMPFPFCDRIQVAFGVATMTALTPFFLSLYLIPFPVISSTLLISSGLVYLITILNFALYFKPLEERFFKHSLLILLIVILLILIWGLIFQWHPIQYIIWFIICTVITFISCADLSGSTSLVKSTLWHWITRGNYDSLFYPVINPKTCTGCKTCIDVCPKNVYQYNSVWNKVSSINPERCCECLACLKQCPVNAIYNKNTGVYKHDIKTIKNLHELMNRKIDF